MAEQSWYIKKYKEYMVHPKRFEFEAKKERLKGKSIYSVIRAIILIVGIGVVTICIIIATVSFFEGFAHENDVVTDFFVPLGIALIVGIVAMPLLLGLSKGVIRRCSTIIHRRDLSDLRDEYYDKYGLVDITLEDLYKNDCGELDDWDNWICSATGQGISYQKLCACRRDGCRNCEILQGVLFDDMDFDLIRKNEKNFHESERLNKEKAKIQKSSNQKEIGSNMDDELLELMQQGEPVKKDIRENIFLACFVISIVGGIIVILILDKFGY